MSPFVTIEYENWPHDGEKKFHPDIKYIYSISTCRRQVDCRFNWYATWFHFVLSCSASSLSFTFLFGWLLISGTDVFEGADVSRQYHHFFVIKSSFHNLSQIKVTATLNYDFYIPRLHAYNAQMIRSPSKPSRSVWVQRHPPHRVVGCRWNQFHSKLNRRFQAVTDFFNHLNKLMRINQRITFKRTDE